MDWNARPQILQKWQPFGVQQMHAHQQQQQQIHQHHLQQQHHPQHHPQEIHHVQVHTTSAAIVTHHATPEPAPPPPPPTKASKGAGSTAPHCLVCNVHLGMFAKGGMEVFSDKVTTSHQKQQIHSILSTIVNQELSTSGVHSNIVCKKCFKLIDDIDAMEDKITNMKQVVSSKYKTTLSLVKKGMIGKAVVDDLNKSANKRPKEDKKPSIELVSIDDKDERRDKKDKAGKSRKHSNLSVTAGKLVVKRPIEDDNSEPLDNEEAGDDPEFKEDNLNVVIIEDVAVDNYDEDASFICSVCDKAFDSKDSLVVHMEEHGLKEDWLTCTVCNKGFLTAESLSKHKKLHAGYGSKKTKKKSSTTDGRIKHYKCKLCNKIFTTKSKALDHERTHTGEKPFECDICGICFRQKSNLSSHKRVTHLQEKRYQCQVCGKAFKWKRLLKGHNMSVHTGERPYKCEFCDAGFVYQQHYKKHMRIHTGEKPFKCEVCGKAFNSSNNCRAHMYTHSDRKPYECRICGTGFMRKPLVLTHIKQHTHGSEDPEAYVKFNSPASVAALLMEGNSCSNGKIGSYSPKKKAKVEASHGAQSIHVQSGHQSSQGNIEETVAELFIPEQVVGREGQQNSGEAVNYMFSNFQNQGPTITHYTSLGLGQW